MGAIQLQRERTLATLTSRVCTSSKKTWWTRSTCTDRFYNLQACIKSMNTRFLKIVKHATFDSEIKILPKILTSVPL